MFTSDPIENQYFSFLDLKMIFPTSAHMTPDTISCQQSGLGTGTDSKTQKSGAQRANWFVKTALKYQLQH